MHVTGSQSELMHDLQLRLQDQGTVEKQHYLGFVKDGCFAHPADMPSDGRSCRGLWPIQLLMQLTCQLSIITVHMDRRDMDGGLLLLSLMFISWFQPLQWRAAMTFACKHNCFCILQTHCEQGKTRAKWMLKKQLLHC